MNDQTLALVKLRAEELLAFFGIEGPVKITEADGTVEVTVDTASGGRLIGHRGETLRALQYVLNLIVRRQADGPVFVSLDIAGYKQAQIERLAAKAKEAADQVIESGKEQYLRPMTAAERRIIHMTLSEFPEVVTESEGEGQNRRVVIRPAK